MNFASNILLAHAQGYGGSDEDYGLIVCFRHDSSPYGFNDAMWEKYGELFVGRTGVSNRNGDPVAINPLSVERTYGNRSNTIDAMSSRGVRFAVCDLSTRGYGWHVGAVPPAERLKRFTRNWSATPSLPATSCLQELWPLLALRSMGTASCTRLSSQRPTKGN